VIGDVGGVVPGGGVPGGGDGRACPDNGVSAPLMLSLAACRRGALTDVDDLRAAQPGGRPYVSRPESLGTELPGRAGRPGDAGLLGKRHQLPGVAVLGAPCPVGRTSRGLLRALQKPHNSATRWPIPTGIPRTRRHTPIHLLCLLKARRSPVTSFDVRELGCWSFSRQVLFGATEPLESGSSTVSLFILRIRWSEGCRSVKHQARKQFRPDLLTSHRRKASPASLIALRSELGAQSVEPTPRFVS
jgi:hypothetical protein